MHLAAITAARPDQFVGVVAVGAADDDHHIALLGQFSGGMLALLCWLADGVNEPDFGMNEEEIARYWCQRSGIPWLGRADIGHDINNKIVPFGASVR